MIDPGEVFILNPSSDGTNDISVLSIIATLRRQNECLGRVYTPSEPVGAIPESLDKGFPHAECAGMDHGLKITLGTGRQRGRSSKLHCSVPDHKSR